MWGTAPFSFLQGILIMLGSNLYSDFQTIMAAKRADERWWTQSGPPMRNKISAANSPKFAMQSLPLLLLSLRAVPSNQGKVRL